MRLIDLLGAPLKSESVLRALEDYDMEITYHVDRLFENQPDSYSSNASEYGFSFAFDAQQILKSVFCFVVEADGFAPVDTSMMGVPIYRTIQEAKIDAERLKVKPSQGGPIEAFDRVVEWVRLDWPDHSRHYEFETGELRQVTLMIRSPS